MEEKISIAVTESQYIAIDAIRGLESAAHSMVMCADHTPNGWILNGSAEAFDKLLGDLHMEVDERMCPKKNIRFLVQVIEKIETEIPCEDIF